jgi:hypothetical protein
MQDQPLTITKTDLQDMMVATIKAAREPNSTEQRKIDADDKEFEQAQSIRLQTAESQKQEIASKRFVAKTCTHRRKDGSYRVTHVQERNGPGYMLCLWNQCKIRPGIAPEGYEGIDVYSTDKFNELFQANPAMGEIFV